MAEYISREAANKWFAEMFISLDHSDEGCKELIERFNKGIPVADVVEVVRCGNCKTWQKETQDYGWCYKTKHSQKSDFFCADGERKDNG